MLSDGPFAPDNSDTSLFLRGGLGVARNFAMNDGFALSSSIGLSGFHELTDGRTGASVGTAIGLTGPDGTRAGFTFGLSGSGDDQISGTGSIRLELPLN